MTKYYDYYNHKINFPDTPNPFKAPPKYYAPSNAGKKGKLCDKNYEPETDKKEDCSNAKTDPQ